MERESFEDPATAALMNELFVCIKVDREERPDVDAIYMEACQTMTGQGGWPLNAFINPQQVPFYVGTYFPPEPRHGMPGWQTVLRAVADAWRDRRGEIDEQSERLRAALGASARIQPSPDAVDDARVTRPPHAGADLRLENGGWGGAPKFPMSSDIEFLLARGELTTPRARCARWRAAGSTTRSAAASRGTRSTPPGRSRTSRRCCTTTRCWRGPTCTAGRCPATSRLQEVCRETLDWALREMRGDEGGFCSALDADSEGVEGKFYAWRLDELRNVLGYELADSAIAYFGATERGNFEGTG